ncbi:MAG: hypothetical protein SF066_22615 [Thermoanaerobaculia bacterium]|nr:hypothetical protein [Thermoanaerobaculia bacterium]
MNATALLLASLLLAAEPGPVPPLPALSAAAAAPAFALAREACERDGGVLWGKSLCGPILLIDPVSRQVVASHGDGEGRLTAQNGVWLGTLPTEVSPANTALDWAGVRWIAVLWPLPESPREQTRLLLHEAFHRIQDQLRLPANQPDNAHLDGEVGRVWLQLEWRALLRAYEVGVSSGRKEAFVDALAFRLHRWQLLPEGRDAEIALEKNEGLAEYTGIVLSGDGGAARLQVVENLRAAPGKPSFVRSFAYASGPAYGLVLDSLRPKWRLEMPNRVIDLGRLLALSLGINAEEWQKLAATAPERAARYQGAELMAAERIRAETRAAQRAEWRARLVTGRVVRLDFRAMNITFDPGELVPLEEAGTVYPGTRITDAWGVLEVTSGGALVASDWSHVRVAAGDKPRRKGNVWTGSGWRLELAPGWRLVRAKGTGWTVEPEAP